jgi:hypothetical protein
MTRVLLALLALLGFVVQAAPAEATGSHGVGSAEVGAPAAARTTARVAVVQIAGLAPVVSRPGGFRIDRTSSTAGEETVRIRTVLTGIDRARE